MDAPGLGKARSRANALAAEMTKFKSRDDAISWISRRGNELVTSDPNITRSEIATILTNELSARCGLIVEVIAVSGDDDFHIMLPHDAIEGKGQ
jgi:hypothetical protein